MLGHKLIHRRASFVRDIVFSANDGAITTFAVIAGAYGASLSTEVVIVLGFANLLADGLAMASGNYLGVKSQKEYESALGDKEDLLGSALGHGFTTLVSFAVAGFLPLLPYLLKIQYRFFFSAILMTAVLFAIGGLRGVISKRSYFKSGMEMLIVGGLAATVAFGVGFLLDKYVI